jgi:hypothetical protein
LPSFVDGFRSFMADKGSPKLYSKWSAIFTIAAVLERKVWVTTKKGKLYPNQYIILVGPAGIGKSVCTNAAYDLINDIKGPEVILHMAPTSVTKASLIDALNGAERSIMRVNGHASLDRFNSLIIIPNELGVFMPAWEGDFMNTMTDLWDNKRYAETRRTKSINLEIANPQLNMLSATTPNYLNTLLPEGAWETGFMSRTLLAYSGEVIYSDLFGGDTVDTTGELWKNLKIDLRSIYKLYGEMQPTDEFITAINAWSRSGGHPAPDHPKLTSYITRRAAHLLKLCVIASASSSDEMLLTIDHFVEALDWLTELEKFIPDIFKSMKSGGDARAMEELYHFVYQEFIRSKDPVPSYLVHAFLSERVPVHNIEPIISSMLKSRLFDEKYCKGGEKGFEPRGKMA